MIRVYFPHVILCKQNRCKAARSAWHSVISLEASHVIDTVALSGSSKGVWLPCCSVWKQCLTLCDLMNYSTPGFPVLHYLSEFAQTHVHWVDDAIQPSHPLLSAFSSSTQSFPASGSFQWVSSSHQVAKVMEFQLQDQSFQWIFKVDFL